MSSQQKLVRYLFSLILASLVLAGCATQDYSADADQAVDAAEEDESPFKDAVKNIVERPLDANSMALLLEAELSVYRGSLDRALAIYAHEAQQTLDAGIAKRYAEVAYASEDIFTLLDAALLWYELAPEDEAAQQLAILALAKMGEVEGAWEIATSNPENHTAFRILAAETRQSEFGPQMAWLAEQIIDVYGMRPNSSELLIALSILSEGTDQIEASASYAEGAALLEPEDILPARLHARALMSLQQQTAATEAIIKFVDNKRAKQEDRIQMAQLLASINPEVALPVFVDLAEDYPWSAELQLGAAQLLLAQERIEEAEAYYVKLSRVGEYRDLAHFNLGRIYEYREDIDRAREYYFMVSPGDLEFESRLRATLLLADAPAEQLDAEFKSLLGYFPDQSAAIYHEHGRLLASKNQEQRALTIFSEGLLAHPDNESLLYARSVVYESIDQIDEAIADLRTILNQDSENVSALNALGYTLANRTDQYDEAYELIARALAMNPDDPAIIDSMGWVLYRLGQYEEALEYLARAHEAFFDVEIVSHLVAVLIELDRVQDAKNLIDDSLQKLPENEILQQLETRLRAIES